MCFFNYVVLGVVFYVRNRIKLFETSALGYERSFNDWNTARTTDAAVRKQSLKI